MKKKIFFCIVFMILILFGILYYFGLIPSEKYTLNDFNIDTIESSVDFNNN